MSIVRRSAVSLWLMIAVSAAVVITVVYTADQMTDFPSGTITYTIAGTPYLDAKYVCRNSTFQTAYCEMFHILANSTGNNITINFSVSAPQTACRIALTNSTLDELHIFANNESWTVPDGYINGSTFGLKITRLIASSSSGNCTFTVVGN